jgi:hypothetical protein
MFSQIFPTGMRNMGRSCAKQWQKNSLLLSLIFLRYDKHCFFPAFQNQYILDFSTASRGGNTGICQTLRIFQSNDVASGLFEMGL